MIGARIWSRLRPWRWRDGDGDGDESARCPGCGTFDLAARIRGDTCSVCRSRDPLDRAIAARSRAALAAEARAAPALAARADRLRAEAARRGLVVPWPSRGPATATVRAGPGLALARTEEGGVRATVDPASPGAEIPDVPRGAAIATPAAVDAQWAPADDLVTLRLRPGRPPE